VTDKSPTPQNRQDPHLDPADDSDEPAFDWMRPAAPGTGEPDHDAGSSGTGAGASAVPAAGAVPGASAVPGSRAARKAAAAAADRAAPEEELHTSALQIRPPREEVERRNAEREQAAKAKPVLPRVMQVLLAVCFPVILLVLAVRAVTSPLFLWVEYNRPGFPGDGYGFSTDDRMTYGSYAVDYLSNWAGRRYLGELLDRNKDQLFKAGEVSHMADVKLVILSAFGAGVVLILLSLIAMIYLRRRSAGGVRRGLFAGSIVSLALIVGLGVLAVLGWEQFFTEFHRLFFANGTWTFSLQDTLIRLFPGQFWVDAGIVIGALVLLASLLTLILTWPTRKRRGLPKRRAAADAASEEDEGAAAEGGRGSQAAGEPAGGQAGKRPRFGRRAKAANPGAEEDPADGPVNFIAGTGADSGTGTGFDHAEADGKPSRGHSGAI
jgi:integral membrane protein (TIGR01906 family)